MLRNDPFSLSGEVALITGGGTGLGFAIATAMLAAGAKVVITGRREGVLRTAGQKLGSSASWFVHDVTDTSGAETLLSKINEIVGDVTILVNNAGIHLKMPALETSDEEFRSMLDTHVSGAFTLTRLVARRMTQRQHGSIIFVASMASLIGVPKAVAYSAAKAAYLGMVRSLACELAPQGVRVNAIAPGWIETPMLDQALNGDHERSERILSRTPMSRFGQPSDVGFASVYLSSPAAAFVNGVILPVDGGASIGF